MASQNFLVWTGNKTQRFASGSNNINFLSVSVGADGLTIQETSGNFDFGGHVLANISAASAPGQAVEYSQLTTALGNYIPTSAEGANNGVATLDSGGKIPLSQMPASLMEYKGTWNATTNSPVLADGTGTSGFFYRVQVAGTQNLGSGAQTFVVGDWVMYNGSIWQLAHAGADAVVSVNSQSGIVVLTTDNIAEGLTNEYFTPSRAQSAAVEDSVVGSHHTIAPSGAAVSTAIGDETTRAETAEGLLLDLAGTRAMTGALNLNTHQIHNVVDPSSAQDAATKNYVDTHSGGSTGAAISMDHIGSSTFQSAQDMQDVFNSAGWLAGGAVTDNGNGTVAVALGQGAIRTSGSATADLKFFDWAAVPSLVLTDLSLNFVYVNYSGGTPIVVANLSQQPDSYQYVALAQIYRNGTDLDINSAVKQVVGDVPNLIGQFNRAVNPFSHESGAVLSASGTRNIAITTGAFWEGLTRFTTSAFDSSNGTGSEGGTFFYEYQNGSGGWTQVAGSTLIDNTHYDNGTGTLASLGSGNYGVAWVYLETDSDVVVLYGQAAYATLLTAQGSEPPASLPSRLLEPGRLLGRIIILNAASSFTEVDSSFALSFVAGSPVNHNELSGLQGGTANQYYHLTAAQETIATQAASASQSGYLTSTDWSTFNGKQAALTPGDGIGISGATISVNYTDAYENNSGSSVTVGQVGYIQSDGTVTLAIATVSTLDQNVLVVVSDASITNLATGNFYDRVGAVIGGYTGLTPGQKCYVSNTTAGAITQSLGSWVAGQQIYSVGRAISATHIEFDPQFVLQY